MMFVTLSPTRQGFGGLRFHHLAAVVLGRWVAGSSLAALKAEHSRESEKRVAAAKARYNRNDDMRHWRLSLNSQEFPQRSFRSRNSA
jgi:hypothetical protein